jgi:hypothetical protein
MNEFNENNRCNSQASLTAPTAPVPAMDRRLATGELFWLRSSGKFVAVVRNQKKNSRDALQESGWVPTRNKASVNVPRVNSRSQQRVCHACKQRDDGPLVVGFVGLLE